MVDFCILLLLLLLKVMRKKLVNP